MVRVVSGLQFTTEARFRFRACPCEICGERSGTGTGFSPSNSVLPCQYHSTIAPYSFIHSFVRSFVRSFVPSFIYMLLLPEEQTGKAWGPYKK
jgi:hypothetical protein